MRLQNLEQEYKELRQETDQLVQELQIGGERLYPEELTRVNRVVEEIRTYGQQLVVSKTDLRSALDQCAAIIPQAQNAVDDLRPAIEDLNAALSQLSRLIARFDGLEFECSNGTSIRELKIRVVDLER